MIICQLNLYDTYSIRNDDSLQFNCLNYYVRNDQFAYQDLRNVIDEVISYCFRPTSEIYAPHGDFVSTQGQKLRFEALRVANITAQQLLWWSAPIDLAERYQFYLNAINSSLNEYFYNCTKPWFGPRCQYSFEFSENMSMNEIVKAAFDRRMMYTALESSDLVTQLPCYTHIRCDRGEPLCLDWREVCDGQVDCLDGGLDEALCFDMEANECGEDEFRCHNGLCIPEEFWEDGLGTSECLDRSDEISNAPYLTSCFRDPTFHCEEHSCRPNWHPFACGDGQCVRKFNECPNGRHTLLAQSMIIKGSLSDKCRIAMVCLTKLVKQINGSSCETWLMNNSVTEFLQECDNLFQFPTIPVHYGHIYFMYEKHNLRLHNSTLLFPNYICYDQQLCDFLISNFSYENHTCIDVHELLFKLRFDAQSWADMIQWVEYHFRSCFITRMAFYNTTKYRDHLSLYRCQNSSKLISKDRIVDEYKDCHLGDDEDYPDSCSLKDKYRVICPNENKCLSSSLDIDYCSTFSIQNERRIPFSALCDGSPSYRDSNEQTLTDESDCPSHWPCNNMYSRCDGFLTCDDGLDEANCNQTMCSPGTHACVSPLNYTLFCLPFEQIDDDRTDCLGASDELQYCRDPYISNFDAAYFRCLSNSNTEMCLKSSALCDNVPSCHDGDDENFCGSRRLVCHENFPDKRTEVENVLCRLAGDANSRTRFFSLHTSSIYPPERSDVDAAKSWETERHILTSNIGSRIGNNEWSWYCNRGLVVRIALKNNSEARACMCPPSYYGHLCQYQNERVSLTVGLAGANRRVTYVIVIMLIDDDDDYQRIESHDQTVYIAKQSCNIKLNRYLLYSKRPKNPLKNYSVRIEVFEKNTMIYVGSWHFNISFLFLPVNRLAVVLVLPSKEAQRSTNCLTTCNNGICIKYINKEKHFCRCSRGWSGVQCNIKINCESCSSDSICLGSVNNRSICVCPLTKSGPRCLLTSSSPAHACQNDGQFVPADASVPSSDYTCICSDQFFGSKCEKKKAIVDVYLNDMDIPHYLLAYFFTISRQAEPTSTIVLQKLTLFQRTVTFRISIHYHLMIIKASSKFYLAVVQQNLSMDISTSINPSRQCLPIEELFNSTMMKMPWLRRVKFYHTPCQTRRNLNCFLDDIYLCLCTDERHANCLLFNRNQTLQCPLDHSCVNGAQCLQDHPTCPSSRICVCTDCFFGNQCQLYAKGFGMTLDEILGYEIKHNVKLSDQAFSVQISALITMIMSVAGIINSILSILTFKNKRVQEVGCGIYLLGSSITSLLNVILFTLKFWFLFLSHMDSFVKRSITYANCMSVEPLLKALLYLDNWLNACVAIERVFAVSKGVNFNKNASKRAAKRVIICLIIVIFLLFIPQLSSLRLFDDEKEERSWCVVNYSPLLYYYSRSIIIFHFFTPLAINLLSAVFIIIKTTLQKAAVKSDQTFREHLISKLKQFKALLISPLVLVVLSLPHLIISFVLDCNKSSRHFAFYLSGYFISFIPSVLIFIVFVLPSSTYKKEFQATIARLRRRFSILKVNFRA